MRVCIVTIAHLSNNPRVVKEADALAAAGHDVRVIAGDAQPHFRANDDRLMATRAWRLVRIPMFRSGSVVQQARWAAAGVAERAARRAFGFGLRLPSVRDTAFSKWHRDLYREAVREPTDLVIAHYAQALPAAFAAARTLGARFAFDAEDLHVGELPDVPEHAMQRSLVAAVERAYLPLCDTTTASSDPIADELVRLYGIRRPGVVLNVFPASERGAPVNRNERSGELSLYWYSQIIGEDRGLDDALSALALLPDAVHLSLRGEIRDGYRRVLEQRTAELGIAHRVHLLPHAPPDELVALASQHDVGLALEPGASLNRRVAITNKLFTYMLAGLGLAATDTPGQRAVLGNAPDVGFIYRPGDAAALASGLRGWLENPAALRAARDAALNAALGRYSWEYEAERLVRHLTTSDNDPTDAAESPPVLIATS